jgi:hypothetical protein
MPGPSTTCNAVLGALGAVGRPAPVCAHCLDQRGSRAEGAAKYGDDLHSPGTRERGRRSDKSQYETEHS